MAKKRKNRKTRKTVFIDPKEVWVRDEGGVEVNRRGDDLGPEHLKTKSKACFSCSGKGTVGVVSYAGSLTERRRICELCLGTGKQTLDIQAAHNLVIEEMQASARDRRSSVNRRRSNLDILLAAMEIDRRQYDAGMLFKADYDRGHLHGYKVSNPESVGGGGYHNQSNPAADFEVARTRVMAVMRKLGGWNSTHGMVACKLIGEELPVLKALDGAGLPRTHLHRDRMAVALVEVLDIMANHYAPTKRS